jgi:ABC-type Mn2+/Zn2+ transport system permease subunit
MTELLSYHFMQRALIAGTLIGAVCAIIGTYVVLKGLSFIGAGIAHASFGGVALGFFLKLNPVLTAVFFCLGTAWGIGLVSRKGQVKEDTASSALSRVTTWTCSVISSAAFWLSAEMTYGSPSD